MPGAEGIPGTGGSGRAQGKGTGAVPGFPSALSPRQWGPLGTLGFFFPQTLVLHRCARPLHRCAAPLGCALSAGAPGRGAPDPTGHGPSSSLFSPYRCRLAVFINGSTALGSREPFLLQLMCRSAVTCKDPGLWQDRAWIWVKPISLLPRPRGQWGSLVCESWGGPETSRGFV